MLIDLCHRIPVAAYDWTDATESIKEDIIEACEDIDALDPVTAVQEIYEIMQTHGLWREVGPFANSVNCKMVLKKGWIRTSLHYLHAR